MIWLAMFSASIGVFGGIILCLVVMGWWGNKREIENERLKKEAIQEGLDKGRRKGKEEAERIINEALETRKETIKAYYEAEFQNLMAMNRDIKSREKWDQVAEWLKYIKTVDNLCDDLNVAMKDVMTQAMRIKAEVDLVKKKDGRPPSLQSIRKSCLRIFKIKAEVRKMKEVIEKKPKML